jgi:hypothetical protein
MGCAARGKARRGRIGLAGRKAGLKTGDIIDLADGVEVETNSP